MPNLGDPLQYAARALTIHRFLMRLANALPLAFLWIFIFAYFASDGQRVGDALAHTLLLYALSEVVTILAMPIALRYIAPSMLRGIVFGAALLGLTYAYVGALALGLFPHGVAAIGVLFGLYRALYRVPYTVESAAAPEWRSHPAAEFVLAMMPLVAGFMLSGGFSFSTLLFLSAILAVMALGPAALVPTVQDRFSWGYRETFMHFLRESNASLVFFSMLHGANGLVFVVLWPLALFLLGVPTPALLGALVSATLLLTLLARSRKAMLILELRTDGGSYLDEYTALKEMGSSLGRAIVCGAIAVIAVLF